jgi:tRNA dimethylallyltransferase
MNKASILCLLGPTASGKTHLAIQLADQLPCDLISVDSAMVYRSLNIGTAKPDAATLQAYPHALIDICDPATPYSAAQFRDDALKCIEHSLSQHRLPVLVGGSMLYHHVLQHGIADLPAANPTLRAELQQKAKTDGWDTLHRDLQHIDPSAAERIHPNDPQRLLRALEVFYVSGNTLSSYWAQQETQRLPYEFINIGLQVERPVLRQRIAERFHQMMQQGFLDEVRALYARSDMHADLPSMRSVGYQQAWHYLQGNITHEHMLEQAINTTRQLAKRQMTWLRRWPAIHWVNPESDVCLDEILRKIDQ